MLARVLAFAATGVACLALAPSAASASASAGPFPSCSALAASHSLPADGTFRVPRSTAIPRPVQLRCALAGPVFLVYLVLPDTGGPANFSRYTAGGASPGTDVVTHYSAIRFDPVPASRNPLTFRANIADGTFSSSAGRLCHGSAATPCPAGQLVTSMPYGVAMDCVGVDSMSGAANLDLRGTPFGVANTFSIQGFLPGGGATFAGPQVVNVTGGGFCGWDAPAPTFNPFNDNPANDAQGGWDLLLTVV